MILVSPSLEILLLHRVHTSSAFPSAHVFPGGNIDEGDGSIPEEGIERHQDCQAYRVGALRELFEESGILLAFRDEQRKQWLSVPQKVREEGRRLVHSGTSSFREWLQQQSSNAVLDTANLIPFTHWITPAGMARRFTTQMYLYFLPRTASAFNEVGVQNERTLAQASDFIPSSDGNVENAAATFASPRRWLDLCRSYEIILPPPQFLLLHLIAQILDDQGLESKERIQRLKEFVLSTPENRSLPWSKRSISPYVLTLQPREDGRVVMGLDKPGPEIEELGKALPDGEVERVLLVKFAKDGPRDLEIQWRRDFTEKGRGHQQQNGPRGKL